MDYSHDHNYVVFCLPIEADQRAPIDQYSPFHVYHDSTVLPFCVGFELEINAALMALLRTPLQDGR